MVTSIEVASYPLLALSALGLTLCLHQAPLDMDLFSADTEKSVENARASQGMMDEEQIGGGYALRPNIKTTPLAHVKATKHTAGDLLAVQSMARRRQENPDYVSAPEISSYASQSAKKPPPVTGWEDVEPERILQLASDDVDPFESDLFSPPGSPTPRQPYKRSTNSTASVAPDKLPAGAPSTDVGVTTKFSNSAIENSALDVDPMHDDADDNETGTWGWDEDSGTKAPKGRRTNVIRRKIDDGFESIREQFRRIADETGRPVSSLHSEFHSRHSLTTSTSDWRIYESYFKHNRRQEVARHRDEDGNPVPDATGTNCWSTFKLLPNHRKLLAAFQELHATSQDQTLRQRRRTFDQTFHKFRTAMDRAYQDNFEVYICMVGGCINEDGSLAASHCTPGLVELPDRLGLTSEEITTYAKIEAYHVRGIAASKEVIENRKAATRSERHESLSATTTSTVATVDSEDVKQEKPMTADTIRSACKNAIFDMFLEFGHPLKGTKGKGKSTDPSSNQMPWSTLPGMLAAMGIQICDYPWEVEPPSNNTTQGIKSLQTASARQLLSALQGQTFWTPYLKIAEKPEDLRSNKTPVILSVGPPPESHDTFGHVVFGNATWVKNSKEHGLPRRSAGTTTVKASSSPGTPASIPPSSPPPKRPSKGKRTRFASKVRKGRKSESQESEDDYEEESDEDDDKNITVMKAPKRRYVDSISSGDDTVENPSDAVGTGTRTSKRQSGMGSQQKVVDVVAKGKRIAEATVQRTVKATTSTKPQTKPRLVQPVVELQPPRQGASTHHVAHSPPITAIRISDGSTPIIQHPTAPTALSNDTVTPSNDGITSIGLPSSNVATISSSTVGTAIPNVETTAGISSSNVTTTVETTVANATNIPDANVSTTVSKIDVTPTTDPDVGKIIPDYTRTLGLNVVATSNTNPSSDAGAAVFNTANVSTASPDVGNVTPSFNVGNTSTTIPNSDVATTPTSIPSSNVGTVTSNASATSPTANNAAISTVTTTLASSNVGTAVSNVAAASTAISDVTSTSNVHTALVVGAAIPNVGVSTTSNFARIAIPSDDRDAPVTGKRCASPLGSEPPSKRLREHDANGDSGTQSGERQPQPSGLTVGTSPALSTVPVPHIKLEALEVGAAQPFAPHTMWYGPPSVPLSTRPSPVPEGGPGSQPVPWRSYPPTSHGPHLQPSPAPDTAMDGVNLPANPHPLPHYLWLPPPAQTVRPSAAPEVASLNPNPNVQPPSMAQNPNVQPPSMAPSQGWDPNAYHHGYYAPPPGSSYPYMAHPSMQDNRQPPTAYNPYYPPPNLYGMYGPAYPAPNHLPPAAYGEAAQRYHHHAAPWSGGEPQGTQHGTHPLSSTPNQD
ncbi:hypothetical protein H0H93_006015 [Arthromyces matolae]|nr:hypothetical protein H0H93_006015 [Arthromyces matolae]